MDRTEFEEKLSAWSGEDKSYRIAAASSQFTGVIVGWDDEVVIVEYPVTREAHASTQVYWDQLRWFGHGAVLIADPPVVEGAPNL